MNGLRCVREVVEQINNKSVIFTIYWQVKGMSGLILNRGCEDAAYEVIGLCSKIGADAITKRYDWVHDVILFLGSFGKKLADRYSILASVVLYSLKDLWSVAVKHKQM